VQEAVRLLADGVGRAQALDVLVEQVHYVPSSPETALDAPMVLAMRRAIREQLGRAAVLTGAGGVTIAAKLRRLGHSPVVWRMAPFQEHSANESMTISSNLAEAELIVRLLFDGELTAASGKGGGDPDGAAR
jgi:acetylornithine deacetylase/succinyl-diaminopimelate desuccinylase-like protein